MEEGRSQGVQKSSSGGGNYQILIDLTQLFAFQKMHTVLQKCSTSTMYLLRLVYGVNFFHFLYD